MALDVKELMRPRYEVIADYPGNQNKVGSIIVCPDYDFTAQYWIEANDKYPHLFKKLNWWEHRKVEDMPMFLRSDLDAKSPTFHKIVEWRMRELWGVIDPENRSVCSLMAFNPKFGYFPATEQEYLEYEKSQTKKL